MFKKLKQNNQGQPPPPLGYPIGQTPTAPPSPMMNQQQPPMSYHGFPVGQGPPPPMRPPPMRPPPMNPQFQQGQGQPHPMMNQEPPPISASQMYQIPTSALQILAGYDILFLIDDSTSMNAGSRIAEVEETIEMMASLACEFDSDGVEFCFLNQTELECNVTHPSQVLPLFQKVLWEGMTPIGKRLRDIVNNFKSLKQMNPNTKPLSIIIITDGSATDKPILEETIVDAARSFPQGSIAFQFFQVGTDKQAKEFLTHLDDGLKQKYNIPDIVDCVSSQSGMCLKDIVRKALIGALDSKADAMSSF